MTGETIFVISSEVSHVTHYLKLKIVPGNSNVYNIARDLYRLNCILSKMFLEHRSMAPTL